MAYEPSRGGVRGGRDQFDWADVKVDKDRENYLAHSLMAPVGRWQKGRDLTWYTKESVTSKNKSKLQTEIAAIKKAEEEAMAIALGLKSGSSLATSQLSKQELAEVCQRRKADETDADYHERIKGVGFKSHRIAMMATSSNSVKPGAATAFEQDSSEKGTTNKLVLQSDHHHHRSTKGKRSHKRNSPSATSHEPTSSKQSPLPDSATDVQKHKKKHKHKSGHSHKHKRSRRHDSDSEDDTRTKHHKERKHKRRRHDSSSD